MLKDDDKSNDDQNEKNDDKNDDQTPSKPVTTPPVTTTPGAKTYSLADVQAHASASSCWSIVNG
jgi:hypothetical protein